MIGHWKHKKKENIEKEFECNIHFYCITEKMTGVYSIAEVVDSVHNKYKKTILQVIPNGFDEFELKSLQAVVDLINKRGGVAYIDSDLERSARVIKHAIKYLNNI